MEKISVIVTVLNEEATILALLESLAQQTFLPQEVVIVDGGSSDRTCQIIRDFASHHPDLNLRCVLKKGNRSVGRNAAISETKNEWIVITDAGCIPHKDWLLELVKKAREMKATNFVVAGYYDAHPRTALQEAMVPYVLVMPDKVNPGDFLPATRSMLVTKSAWQKVGGFAEKLSDNEDYAFAHQLKKQDVEMGFTAKAKVIWQPRANLAQFLVMIFRFARGDIFAGIVRPKVLLIFGRYLVAILSLGLFIFAHWSMRIWFALAVMGLLFYALWSIRKNMRYVPRGWYCLPVLQITSDLAVMLGSVAGLLNYKSK